VKKIYLDMNVFSEYAHSDRPLNKFTKNLIKKFKESNYRLLYSPAHIEESAVIFRKENDVNKAKNFIENILYNITEITNNYECLPTEKDIVIKKENPEECYGRVMEKYILTIIAENIEYFSVKHKRDCVDCILTNYNIDRVYIGNIRPENLFNDKKIQKIFSDYNLKLEKWKVIKNNHKKTEITISILYDFLETIGYKSSGEKYYRSMMHDVTHSIYATKSDIFITNDKKFKTRVEAIYAYLEIPTRIYLLKDLKKNEKLLKGLL